jgi:hypothetical protein
MDLKTILRFSSIAAIVAYATLSTTDLGALITIPTTFAQQQQKFMAKLTGQHEVPAKNTKATGIFELQLTANGRLSNYVLNLTNISNVTLVHMHQGAK